MQMVDDARVVVYLMSGFLESGKTSFLKQTIDKQYFKIDGTTVIILCEEGEEEYEEDLLARAKAKIVTVEDPEELDTRFSKFAPFKGNETSDTVQLDGADNIIDIFQKLYEAKVKSSQAKEKNASQGNTAGEKDDTQVPDVNLIRLYEFDTLDDVIAAAHGLNGYFSGANTLYKDPADEIYKLVVHQSSLSPEDFNRVCNILTEYGRGRAFTASGEAYLTEHGELISASALQQLVQL